jgi:hypothetical protein
VAVRSHCDSTSQSFKQLRFQHISIAAALTVMNDRDPAQQNLTL